MNSRKDIQTVATTHRMADVFPTIDTGLGKVGSNQMDKVGAYILVKFRALRDPSPSSDAPTDRTHTMGS